MVLAVLKGIRLEDQKIPVLILSAKGDLEDRIKGLKFGSDDYLAKPFNLKSFFKGKAPSQKVRMGN